MVVLIAGPRPAIELPKPWSDLRASVARLGREGREHVLELRRVRRRVLDRDRVAVLERLAGAAGDQLHVLQAECGARPHRQGRVHGQRLDRLVELEVEDGDHALLAVHLHPVALDVLDDADAEAAGAHLVALHELGAVRHLGLELVGGHEREAVVRLVRDEHGHDRDHHRDRADEDRACPELSSAAPHWPSRKSRAGLVGSAGALSGVAAGAPERRRRPGAPEGARGCGGGRWRPTAAAAASDPASSRPAVSGRGTGCSSRCAPRPA